MGKTSYKNIDDLVKRIDQDVDKLKKGDLSLDDLDALVEAGKDLTERLIILRFKAYDTHGQPEQEIVQKVVEKEDVPDVQFDLSSSEQEESQPVAEQAGFNFDLTFDEEEAAPEEVEINVESKEVMEEEILTPEVHEQSEDAGTINEVHKSEEDHSLRKKFQKSPISDLKSQISIANKFEYISTLFDGDNKKYEEAIQTLNTFEEGDMAKAKLKEFATEYNWDLENKTILQFIELVERRYL